MTSSKRSGDPKGNTALFLAFKKSTHSKMCCGGLAGFFADDRRTNTFEPRKFRIMPQLPPATLGRLADDVAGLIYQML